MQHDDKAPDYITTTTLVNSAETVAERTRSPMMGPANTERTSLRAASYGLATQAIAKLLQTPQYIILFVSDKCWMRCSHCWFNEEWKERELTQAPMVFEDYEKLAQSIKKLGFLSITGGEAFQRPDIVELATMFRKTTQLSRYQIPTSGYRTELIVNAAEQILRANPRTPFRVDVSLDGIADVHDTIRGIKDGFTNAVQTIKELNALKKHYSYFDVGVITTVSRLNQHVIKETAALVESIHPDGEWMINIARGNGRDQAAVEVDPDAYRLAHKLIDERIARGAYKGHGGHWTAKWLSAKNAARRDIIYDIITGQRTGGGCAAGAIAGVIQSDGTVKACEMLDASLGNLRDFNYNLAALWQANTARNQRQFIQQTRCKCTQECFLSVSMLISPTAVGKIVNARWKLDRLGLQN
jgi:MoaA/NifB/PqqE/SkfB family radical SAM enzyme